MAKYSAARWFIFASALSFAALSAKGADTSGNLITNGGFEAGMQIWRGGDGKVVLLPDGNRVCEIEASKSRMKEINQDFHMKQLQQVEVVFRARSIDYKGPGIRVSIHTHGSGALLWNKELPEDGSWREFRIKYTRTTANNDLRELVIATLLGTGKVQIDDVEVREPSQIAENQPTPPLSTPMPTAKPEPPSALVKPKRLATPPPTVPQLPAPVVPAGTFGSLEQIVNSAPPEAVRKLQDSATADAGMAEINAYFDQNVKNKPVSLRIKVEHSEAILNRANKVRIHAQDHAVLSNGVTITSRMWAYFPEATAPADGQVSAGSEIIVSGVLGRCDVSTKDGLRLNVDLSQSKLGAP